MVKAIVLVRTEVGTHSRVAGAVGRLRGVKTAFPITGRYDVAAFADVASLRELSALVRQIGGTEGAVASETLVGLEL